MESDLVGRLVGSDIHGFHTLQDLDFGNIVAEASTRWLRPNEIHAILCNYKYFSIHVKPMNLPPSGTIVLFDRKKLRNFRKDGHSWKKKKDGKTVKEAHERLKVGNEERIHVYYAHGEDQLTFVRRCYWLLDKTLEHIVLVHYRETQELQGSPVTPMNSNSSSVSSNSNSTYYAGKKQLVSNESLTVRNYEMTLHEINTLEWDELVTNDPSSSDKTMDSAQHNQITVNGPMNDGTCLSAHDSSASISPLAHLIDPMTRSDESRFNLPDNGYGQSPEFQVNSNLQSKDPNILEIGDSLDMLVDERLQSQDSFGTWLNYTIVGSTDSVNHIMLESAISSGHDSSSSAAINQIQYSVPEHLFVITDISPAWAFSTDTTKILIIGYFHEQYLHLAKSNLFCVCGDACISVETVQAGVYRCFVSPHFPGLVNIFLSLDGKKPISQVLDFEYRTLLADPLVSSEDKPNWDELKLQVRLAHLLLSTSKGLGILTGKVSPTALKEAKKFTHRTSNIYQNWAYLIKSVEDNRLSFSQAKDDLFELILKNMLKDWLLERVVEGCKTTERDVQGLGVIHLCSILQYKWAVDLFSWSGLSLDFRDKHGWTALHWAAYYGREKIVAVLLSAGAKPNLVTDPTKENPDGFLAAELAAAKGYDGLAAYLSEEALVAHVKDMTTAGNISGTLQQTRYDVGNSDNLSEEELYLKDTLAAYRTAADAAGRIQSAFREHSLKVRTRAVWSTSPEDEARNIVAALKIQHAFRKYEARKRMAAAARIQYRFRTWKMRKEFLNMRRQAIKIQAAFRGFQGRRQYRKITWSVGVLEKAILRWRLKRRGIRGLKVDPIEAVADLKQESDAEEDFYKASRKQAEERVERAVVRVQAMFRSKQAQQEYRRMKLTHNQAKLEYEELLYPDSDNDR